MYGARLKKNAVIRARCEEPLRHDLEAIARQRDLDVSDILRLAAREFVARLRSQTNSFPPQFR